MANGSDVIDEGFFRRYRELLDAEDAAFDELEHAYEDGDRAHWDDDLAAWRKIVEKRCAFLETRGPDARHRRLRAASRTTRSTNARAASTTRSVRPTKKWLAPAITSISVAFQSLGRLDHRRRLAELVVLSEHEQLRARVGGDRAEVGARTAAAARSRATPRAAASCGRERHVGAERPPREQRAVRRRRRAIAAAASTAACTSRSSPRPSSWVPVLRSTPRKLKRRQVTPASGSASNSAPITIERMVPPYCGWGWHSTDGGRAGAVRAWPARPPGSRRRRWRGSVAARRHRDHDA